MMNTASSGPSLIRGGIRVDGRRHHPGQDRGRERPAVPEQDQHYDPRPRRSVAVPGHLGNLLAQHEQDDDLEHRWHPGADRFSPPSLARRSGPDNRRCSDSGRACNLGLHPTVRFRPQSAARDEYPATACRARACEARMSRTPNPAPSSPRPTVAGLATRTVLAGWAFLPTLEVPGRSVGHGPAVLPRVPRHAVLGEAAVAGTPRPAPRSWAGPPRSSWCRGDGRRPRVAMAGRRADVPPARLLAALLLSLAVLTLDRRRAGHWLKVVCPGRGVLDLHGAAALRAWSGTSAGRSRRVATARLARTCSRRSACRPWPRGTSSSLTRCGSGSSMRAAG